VSSEGHETDCPCFECHFARRMAEWNLWCELLTELHKEILHRHWRTTDYELVAVTAPQSISYSIELFRPRSNDSPMRKVVAYWATEHRIDVHLPGSVAATEFRVRVENGIATLDGKTAVDFVSLILGPFAK
jgi:hypothetical protein